VGTGDLLIGFVFEQFVHARGTTAVLVHAHHHGRVVVSIELAHAQKALQFELGLEQGLDVLGNPFSSKQIH